MRNMSLKALTALLLTTCLTLASHAVLAEAKVPYKVNAEQQLVHLNHSTVAQLSTLKGIGPKKAAAIIAYREEVGAFTSVNELLKVKGIGEKVIIDNKNKLAI